MSYERRGARQRPRREAERMLRGENETGVRARPNESFIDDDNDRRRTE